MNARWLLFITLTAIVVLAAGCGGGAATAPTPTPVPPSPTPPPTATATVAPTATLAPTATATATPEPKPTRRAQGKRRRTPTPTLDLQAALAGRLVEFEDSNDLFSLQYPGSLTQVEPSVEEENKLVVYTLTSPDEREQLIVVISVEKETPLNDEEWEQALLPSALTFIGIMGEDVTHKQVIEEARSLYLETASDEKYGLFLAEEKSGVVGALIWAMPPETWENQRQDVADKVVGSFVWSPYTVRRFFGDIQTYRDPAGLFSLPIPTHMEQVETLDDYPMYGLMARSEQTGERLLFLLFDASTDELDDLFFDTMSQLEVELFGRPVTAEAETTYDAQDFLVTFTAPFDSADGTIRGVEAIWEPQQGVRALFFWLAPAEVFVGGYAGDVVAPLFFDIRWDPAGASARFAGQGTAPSGAAPTAVASPTPSAGTSRPAITAENAASLRQLGRLSLDEGVNDLEWVSGDTMLAVVTAERLSFYNDRLELIGPPQEIPTVLVAFSPDDQVVYTVFQDEADPLGTYTVVARPLDRLDAPTWSTKLSGLAGVFDFDVSPDGRWLAVAEGNASVHLLDTQTGEVKATLKVPYQGAHAPLILGVDFSPDSTLLGAVAYGDIFHVWRVADGSDVAHGQESLYSSSASFLFAANDRFYVGGNTAVIERRTDGTEVSRLQVDGTAYQMALSADGSLLVVATGDEVLFVERGTGQVVHRVAGTAPVAFADDGTSLAVAGGEKPSPKEVLIFGVQP